MAFKGTQKRTQRQLEMEIENMGGHLNAYTSREQTVYYAKVFKKDVPKAMEMLSDILQNALLSEDAIERERDVILREHEEVSKQYEEVIMDNLHETAFMGTGLSRTILGPVDNIRKLTRKDLVDYINTHYTANRFVVAAAGAVDHKQIVDLTEQHFGSLPTSPKTGGVVSMDPAVFTGSDKRIRFDSMKVRMHAYALLRDRDSVSYFLCFRRPTLLWLSREHHGHLNTPSPSCLCRPCWALGTVQALEAGTWPQSAYCCCLCNGDD